MRGAARRIRGRRATPSRGRRSRSATCSPREDTLSRLSDELLPDKRVPKTLTIVGLGGSLARISRSRAALLTALEGAASAGAETHLLDLRELDLPMYNPDHDEP